ncbi:MAG TPA: SCO family protein [Kofleriaceae bacterium]
MTRAGAIALAMLAGGVAAASPGELPPVPRADTAAPAPGTPAWAERSDVTEHLGDRLPLDLMFVDSTGRRAPLRSLFDGVHPVLLVLAYYECPQLCSLVLDSAAGAMQTLERQGFQLGRQYRVATISFDTTERIDQAARKQASVLGRLGRETVDPAVWPFLVGDAWSVGALTDRLGFAFQRDPRTGAIAHPAVVFVLTPDGVISRYLYGVDYAPRDLKLSLLEASAGKTGSIGDKIALRCFQYDPATRRYGLFVARFMKLGGAMIFVIVAVMFSVLVRHEIRRARGASVP